MKPISLDEQMRIELEILKHFADFCETNGLKYYLAYGTLLGAVRHKGFIPWDDDIDICMPKDDYKKAVELWNEKNADGRYRLVCPYDKIARHPFVKIIDTKTVKIETPVNYKNGYLGIDIDVFYIDGIPEDPKEFSLWCTKYNSVIQKHTNTVLKWFHTSLKTTFKIAILKLTTLHSRKYYLKKAEELHNKYKFNECEWVGHICGSFADNFNNRFRKEWFSDGCKVEFEGCLFNAPLDYHNYLTTLYGDYMTPPPPDKQITHHANNVFWKDKE